MFWAYERDPAMSGACNKSSEWMCQLLLFILYTLNTSKVHKADTFSLNSVLEKTLSFNPHPPKKLLPFSAVEAHDHFNLLL